VTATGKNNQAKGMAFEKLVAGRAEQLGLEALLVKWIDRSGDRYVSKPDLEIIQRPDLKIDCKYTEGRFTIKELKKLLEETRRRYCGESSFPVVVVGQKFGKARLFMEEVTVIVCANPMMIMPLDDWLIMLDSTLKGKVYV
jgi:hypothetical protein